MGRTRGTERGSKPEAAPEGPEFASRTREVNDEGPSVGSPTLSTDGNPAPETTEAPVQLAVNEDPEVRRSSFSNLIKKMW
jgi:hypothetical protein